MPRKPANIRSQIELAKEYLEARKGHCTNEEAAAAAGCSLRTVIRARGLLQRENPLFPPAPGNKFANARLSTEGAEEIERTIAEVRGLEGKPLTDPEKLSMLAALARRAYRDDNAKLAGDLMTVHTRIRDSNKEEAHLGPGAPLSREDRIDRTSVILDCVGPEIAAFAAIRAFQDDDLTLFGTTFDRLKGTAPQSPLIERSTSEAATLSPGRTPDAPDSLGPVA